MNARIALAQRLLKRGGSQESNAGDEAPLTDDELSAVLRERLTEGVLAAPKLEAAEAAELARELVTNVSSVLRRASQGAADSDLSEAELSSLEAIVMLSGRPALRYDNGRLEPLSRLKSNEEWRVLVSADHSQIEDLSRSVARIERLRPGAAPEAIGTGWRLGNDLVVTNRHVAEQLAEDAGLPPEKWKLDSSHTTVVEFAAVDNSAAGRAFALRSIAWCDSNRNGPDLAILAFTVPAGETPPAPLPLERDCNYLGRTIERNREPVFQGRKVYVVGHPFWPGQSSAVTKVFGKADGLKRWSPGYVTGVCSDTPTFRHDCSTLGGHSGSCVLSAETHKVVGLHFSGVNTKAKTGEGTANAALSVALLQGSQAGMILMRGRV